MTTIINADTSGGLKLTSDTSGALDIQSAGSTKLSIDSSGNVGIGATSPSKPLQVRQTAAGSGLSQTDIRATRDEYGADFSGYIDQGVGHGAIISSVDNGTATERVRITNAGKVGIGTTSPSTTLHVAKTTTTLPTIAGDCVGIVSSNGTSALSLISGTGNSVLRFGDSSDENAGQIAYAHADDGMRFNTADSERMRIDSSGKVGIGTTSPDGRLHVHTSSAGTVTAATDANQLVLESTANVGMSFLTGNASAARIKFGDPDSNSSGAIYTFTLIIVCGSTQTAQHVCVYGEMDRF